MKRLSKLALFLTTIPLAAPLVAQTQIGGGSCTSSSVKGNYAMTLTGRKVSSAASFTNVLQANGSVTFDGQSQINVSLTSNTNQATATPVTWSGTYTIQANCSGQVTITSGGTATLNILLYASGRDFVLAGTDAVYSYTGGGSLQPSTCSTGALSGVYTINGTGYSVNSTGPGGVTNGGGLMQFDGLGHVTVSLTLYTAGPTLNPITLSGTYAVSNCLASATLTDSKATTYSMTMSVTGSNATSTSGFAVILGNSAFILSGNAHAAYGQPTALLIATDLAQGGRS